ncbi:MAG: hypothetical protein H0X41_13150 [Chitinophagaceae bacterium]|nr:hypothetical protein [Chitinophagaceae bacterium]
MEQIFMNTIVDKVNACADKVKEQETAIAGLQKNAPAIKEAEANLHSATSIIHQLQENMKTLRFPVEEMNRLSEELNANNQLLSRPRKDKVFHIHTAGRLMSAVIVLSVVVLILGYGWYNTHATLDDYRMHDIIWRQLKLRVSAEPLESLHALETEYQANPSLMKDNVEKAELRLQQDAEARQKVAEAEMELVRRKHEAGDTMLAKPGKKIREKKK